jgi:hypothetical protein
MIDSALMIAVHFINHTFCKKGPIDCGRPPQEPRPDGSSREAKPEYS